MINFKSLADSDGSVQNYLNIDNIKQSKFALNKIISDSNYVNRFSNDFKNHDFFKFYFNIYLDGMYSNRSLFISENDFSRIIELNPSSKNFERFIIELFNVTINPNKNLPLNSDKQKYYNSIIFKINDQILFWNRRDTNTIHFIGNSYNNGVSGKIEELVNVGLLKGKYTVSQISSDNYNVTDIFLILKLILEFSNNTKLNNAEEFIRKNLKTYRINKDVSVMQELSIFLEEYVKISGNNNSNDTNPINTVLSRLIYQYDMSGYEFDKTKDITSEFIDFNLEIQNKILNQKFNNEKFSYGSCSRSISGEYVSKIPDIIYFFCKSMSCADHSLFLSKKMFIHQDFNEQIFYQSFVGLQNDHILNKNVEQYCSFKKKNRKEKISFSLYQLSKKNIRIKISNIHVNNKYPLISIIRKTNYSNSNYQLTFIPNVNINSKKELPNFSKVY